jgi:hypothetical protein
MPLCTVPSRPLLQGAIVTLVVARCASADEAMSANATPLTPTTVVMMAILRPTFPP